MPRFYKPSPTGDAAITPDAFMPKIIESGEIKTLFAWVAPSRPFRKKDRSYYTTIAVIVILLILIASQIHEWLLIGTILAFAFVTYVLAFVPPTDVEYKISTQGITIGEHFYFWHVLDSFWFKITDGQKLLIIQTRLQFPGQLMLLIGDSDEEQVKKVVARFLPFHEIPYVSLMDKWTDALQRHFPLENPHSIRHAKDDGCSTC